MNQVKHPVFLDTSIQIQRTLLELKEAAQLEAELSLPTVQMITSNYVWMEYQRTIIADCAHIYGVMSKYTDWGSLFTHLLDGPRAFRPRSAVRCTKIVGRIHQTSGEDYKIAYRLLGAQITHALQRQFWTNVIPISVPIHCDLVRIGVIRQADSNFNVADSCRKESATCYLPNFLAENRPKLESIASYLSANARAIKDQDRVERLLSLILNDPRKALGQSTCWPLGDVIIALQIPSEAVVWTLDADFKPILTALGLSLYKPSFEE